MIKKFLPCVGEYKWHAIFAPITIGLEVLLEIFIPFLMSKIIDVGITNGDVGYVCLMGALMIGAALLSLLCGAVSARLSAVAATTVNLLGYKAPDVWDASIIEIK